MIALAITGPTASGKTALSLEVAEAFDGEIISCDSMQIYKGMNIGTAKATPEEQARAPHHMIDLISPLENYSAEAYRIAATECARQIEARGRLPIFVGGTGLYIDTVIRGSCADSPESSPEYREKILAEIKGEADRQALWERLRRVDPVSAEKIHYNNLKRVIRALEIYDTVGIPKSSLDERTKGKNPDVTVGMITLDFHNRDNLYSRVDRRVDIMLRDGLVGEVRSLYEQGLLSGETTASQAIGYKELLPYLCGECTLEEAAEELKLSSRRYAKRQLTWFRHETDAYRIFVDCEDGRLKGSEELRDEAVSVARTVINSLRGVGDR